MTLEEKAAKLDTALKVFQAEVTDSHVVRAIANFIVEASTESKAMLHDIIKQA